MWLKSARLVIGFAPRDVARGGQPRWSAAAVFSNHANGSFVVTRPCYPGGGQATCQHGRADRGLARVQAVDH